MTILVSRILVSHSFSFYFLVSRWAVAFEVTEDVLDILALNSVSYVRIPAGICLAFVVEFMGET